MHPRLKFFRFSLSPAIAAVRIWSVHRAIALS